MPYKITVWTEDDGEYDLTETFRTHEEAEAELEDILDNRANLDGSPIDSGTIKKI